MDLSLHVSAGGSTVVGAILRSDQAYFELLSTKHTLDWGIAFFSEPFPLLPQGNELREVWIESPGEAEAALHAVTAFFAEQDRVCHRWVLAEAQSPEIVEPVLTAAGFVREDRVALALAAWPDANPNESFRILPARPMRKAYCDVVAESAAIYGEDVSKAQVDAAVERLDDHRMDIFVAMDDKTPAGACGLFQVGDIGRILTPYVMHASRRMGVATAMLDHVISMARRLMMRVVCIDVSTQNEAALSLLKQLGFVDCGRIVEFRAPDVAAIDYQVW